MQGKLNNLMGLLKHNDVEIYNLLAAKFADIESRYPKEDIYNKIYHKIMSLVVNMVKLPEESIDLYSDDFRGLHASLLELSEARK